jgi:hypothetical protein
VAAARTACQQARVLHWPLAFAQVFAAGGFDCVLGNPPWEARKWARRSFLLPAPEVARPQGDKRNGNCRTAAAKPALWQTFVVERPAHCSRQHLSRGGPLPRSPAWAK